jgi:predicted flap endonuclease-1-like 5' DNA nuclease
VVVGGVVEGDLSVLSGNVHLQPTAQIEGDISVFNGNLQRDPGAVVEGDLLQGRDLPRFPRALNLWSERAFADEFQGEFGDEFRAGQVGFWGGLWGFFARIFGAGLMTAVTALLVGLLMYVRPAAVQKVRGTMQEETALSFVVGLLANLTLAFLSGLLAITICLAPVALLPILALLVVNLVGWAAISWLVGERLSTWVKVEAHPAISAAAGAVLLTGVVVFMWALGGCFGFLAYTGSLLIGAAGAGAVLLPWLRRNMNGRAAPGGVPVAPAAAATWHDAGYVADPAAVEPAARQAPVTQVLDDVVATADESAQETAADATEDAESADRWATEATAEAPYTAPTASAMTGGAPVDFTRIRGLDPVSDQRLKAANIRTYGQLAAMSAEEIAEVLGWTVDRVMRSETITQAQALAQAEQG